MSSKKTSSPPTSSDSPNGKKDNDEDDGSSSKISKTTGSTTANSSTTASSTTATTTTTTTLAEDNNDNNNDTAAASGASAAAAATAAKPKTSSSSTKRTNTRRKKRDKSSGQEQKEGDNENNNNQNQRGPYVNAIQNRKLTVEEKKKREELLDQAAFAYLEEKARCNQDKEQQQQQQQQQQTTKQSKGKGKPKAGGRNSSTNLSHGFLQSLVEELQQQQHDCGLLLSSANRFTITNHVNKIKRTKPDLVEQAIASGIAKAVAAAKEEACLKKAAAEAAFALQEAEKRAARNKPPGPTIKVAVSRESLSIPVGVNFRQEDEGPIFVSSIHPTSLFANTSLQVGMQLWKINDLLVLPPPASGNNQQLDNDGDGQNEKQVDLLTVIQTLKKAEDIVVIEAIKVVVPNNSNNFDTAASTDNHPLLASKPKPHNLRSVQELWQQHKDRVNGKLPPPSDATTALSTTNSTINERLNDHDAATEWATKQLMAEIHRAKATNSRLPTKTTERIVEEANIKYNLLSPGSGGIEIPESRLKVNKETVRSRAKRGNPEGRMRSPMEPLEPLLASLVVLCYKMNDPLDCQSFLRLANHLLQQSPNIVTKVKSWQQNCKQPPKPTSQNIAAQKGGGTSLYLQQKGTNLLSPRYYQQFLKRNPDVYTFFKVQKPNWEIYTYKNMEDLYCMTYARLQEFGIARKLPEEGVDDDDGDEVVVGPLLMDIEGNIITSEDDDAADERVYGLPVEYQLLHPQRLLYMDQIQEGYSTCPHQDTVNTLMGSYRSKRNNNKKRARRDHEDDDDDDDEEEVNFTVLPIINALGDPVLCVVIFQSDNTNKIPANWKTGIDITKATSTVEGYAPDTTTTTTTDLVDFLEFINQRSRADEMMPHGPSCRVQVAENTTTDENAPSVSTTIKEVACFCTASPNGGLTSQIVVDILRYLDQQDIFPRSTNNGSLPNPFLILDGHIHNNTTSTSTTSTNTTSNSPTSTTTTTTLGAISFLEYINDKSHEWGACIGVPGGIKIAAAATTSASAENVVASRVGCFSYELNRAKEELVYYKNSQRLDLGFVATDIIPIVNKAWNRCFGSGDNNNNVSNRRKLLLSERGWNPMNRALLLDEEVLKTKDATVPVAPAAAPAPAVAATTTAAVATATATMTATAGASPGEETTPPAAALCVVDDEMEVDVNNNNIDDDAGQQPTSLNRKRKAANNVALL